MFSLALIPNFLLSITGYECETHVVPSLNLDDLAFFESLKSNMIIRLKITWERKTYLGFYLQQSNRFKTKQGNSFLYIHVTHSSYFYKVVFVLTVLPVLTVLNFLRGLLLWLKLYCIPVILCCFSSGMVNIDKNARGLLATTPGSSHYFFLKMSCKENIADAI